MCCPTFTCSTPCCINRAHALSLTRALVHLFINTVYSVLCAHRVLNFYVVHTQSRPDHSGLRSLHGTHGLLHHATFHTSAMATHCVTYVENFRRFDADTLRLLRITCPVVRLRSTNWELSPPRFQTFLVCPEVDISDHRQAKP